ncbi:Membrane carboxypeptidase (penicillin-binding protein) [Amycolatopsis xylanica]|uniref:Membrane carboxypeptidase (Penicillin-binding protein) n=1 Tax=Amycolatopsis xylanica TaxID=589385 RepID=A0A1H3AKC6_9PSEU|nr:transglycosylase domain-containing protein [Amycolatopsis xylanica]SDX29838.1 Membrane carboxypeptidase (penicillin-binding protein) [Amycolatopsis xylanica]
MGRPQRPGPPPNGGVPRRQGPPPPGAGRPPATPPGGYRQGGPQQARRRPPEPQIEPDLITHHEHNGTADDLGYDDYDEARFNDYGTDEPEDTGEGPELDKKGKPILTPAQKKKRRWKIVRRCAYAFVAIFFVIPAIAFTITYFLVDVPSQESVAARQSQPISFTYADGSPMGKMLPPKGGDRKIVKPEEIPDTVKHAVYAAEDATFETNSGFDVTGILRAVFNQLTGGKGGGSTISQQYIKKATENEAPTLTRKWTELVKSFKMTNQQEKPDILASYLNTIFFGRRADGIGAAAKAYFGKDIKDLTQAEAAYLAGAIQGPSRTGNAEYMTKRWNFVMDQLVANKWMTKADRDAAQMPTPIALDDLKDQSEGSPDYFISKKVLAELSEQGFDEDKLFSGGYKIQTTIDPKAQEYAKQSVDEGMKGQTDENMLNALVAVDPKTGGVIAYYGGPEQVKDADGNTKLGQDWASIPHNPGSSMKAYDLAAFLKMNKGLGETFDGTNNRKIGDRTIRNAGESSSCSEQCTVKEAMAISANTVFYDMVYKMGYDKVITAAKDAGIKDKPDGPAVLGKDNNISLGGGTTVATAEDMAASYATFAGDGLRRERHFVLKLTNSADEVAYEPKIEGVPAFASNDPEKSKQIAVNVTEALKGVITSTKTLGKCPTGHECAGKTGTQQYDYTKGKDPANYADRNAQTWMVGYTPSISTAVWVGGDGNKALHGKDGKPIFGSTIAGPIWKNFMNLYLTGKPAEKFPAFKPIGKDPGQVTTSSKKPETPTTTTQPEDTTESNPPSDTTESKPTSSSKTRPGPGGGTGGPIFPQPPAGGNSGRGNGGNGSEP